MTTALDKAVKIIIKIAQPDKIILFGSRVRGNNSVTSDYDLLVIKKGLKKRRRLAQKIYLNFKNIGAPIDIIVIDLEKYENLKNDPYLIYHEAEKYGEIVYERKRKN